MDGWNTIVSFWGRETAYFQGTCVVGSVTCKTHGRPSSRSSTRSPDCRTPPTGISLVGLTMPTNHPKTPGIFWHCWFPLTPSCDQKLLKHNCITKLFRHIMINVLPSRKRTYPTWGKGKSSSNMPYQGDMLIPWRVFVLFLAVVLEHAVGGLEESMNKPKGYKPECFFRHFGGIPLLFTTMWYYVDM